MSENEENAPHLVRLSSRAAQAEMKPIVLKYRGKAKKTKDKSDGKKARYSRGLEDFQRMEGDLTRISQKAAKAVSKGLDTYERERTRSAQEKKDGAVEDYYYNSAKATSAFLKEASDLPIDLAESMYTKTYRKRLRQSLRNSSRMIRMFRI
jgi:hypothetical protein